VEGSHHGLSYGAFHTYGNKGTPSLESYYIVSIFNILLTFKCWWEIHIQDFSSMRLPTEGITYPGSWSTGALLSQHPSGETDKNHIKS
jgi:hypothetical protein